MTISDTAVVGDLSGEAWSVGDTLLRVKRSAPSAVILCVLSALVAGCSGSASQVGTSTTAQFVSVAGLGFGKAPASVHRACERAARQVGYAVPCPTLLPSGVTAYPSGSVHGCSIQIIGAGGLGGCARSWRGWVVGSSQSPHLVLQAAPRVVSNPARAIDGPGWERSYHVTAVLDLGAVL